MTMMGSIRSVNESSSIDKVIRRRRLVSSSNRSVMALTIVYAALCASLQLHVHAFAPSVRSVDVAIRSIAAIGPSSSLHLQTTTTHTRGSSRRNRSRSRSRAALTAATVDAAEAQSSPASQPTAPPPHTIQILMSDTGGGHRASANALRDALDVLYPSQFAVDIVDIYTDYGPFPYNQYVPAYKIMAEYSFLWDWFYHFGATPLGLALNAFFLDVFCFEPFKDCMSRCTPLALADTGINSSNDSNVISAADAKAQRCRTTGRRADMVVSVHPLCQDESLKILAHLDTEGRSKDPADRKTPFVTVVTDLGGAHPTWFNPGVDKCYVPSDALYKAALDRKVQPEQIVEYGLPIRKGFWSERKETSPAAEKGEAGGGNWLTNTFGLGKTGNGNNDSSQQQQSSSSSGKKSKAELRDELDLVQGIPTVLIVGGGDGMGGIVEQARALGQKLNADGEAEGGNGPSFQMVVVCGKNEKAQKQLEADQWGKGVNVQVKGFVYNMDEYMRASDAIVTKAGPGTIAEASICGLPCMLSSYLPGQEAGNVPYVEENGFGTYSGDPKTIADTVSTWLETPKKLSMMQKAALEAARPAATLDIAKDLAEFLFEYKRQSK